MDCWWWSKIWKSNAPLKTIITLWFTLNNRLVTWEMLLKHGFEGPGYCSLCKAKNETHSHLFFHCVYAGTVWKKVVSKLDPSSSIEGEESLEHRMKKWWNNERVGQYETFPTLFVYTIWETRNRAIFKDSLTTP